MFLDAFSPERRKRLKLQAKRRHYSPGDIIFAAGTSGDTIFLLETGRVSVIIYNPEGRRTVLNHLGPGELLGEYAFFDRGPRSADVVAVSDTTGMELGYGQIREALLAEPEAMLELLSEVSRKARDTLQSLENLTQRHAAPRLAKCILRLAEKWGADEAGKTVIAQDFSQGDLGDIAGLARENVNRLLRSWAASDVVTLEEGKLIILDKPALSALAKA